MYIVGLAKLFFKLIGNLISYIFRKNGQKQNKEDILNNDFYMAHMSSSSIVNNIFCASVGLSWNINGIRKKVTNPLDLDPKHKMLNYGDIICVPRKDGIYMHYGIYKRNSEVIHFASENSDFGSDIKIHITTLNDFLKNDKIFFTMRFYDNHPVFYYCCFRMKNDMIEYVPYMYSKNYADNIDLKMMDSFGELNVGEFYSPEETVKRAEQFLNDKNFGKYDILLNNCEHFALWCKTGKVISVQVEKALNRFIKGSMQIGNLKMF